MQNTVKDFWESSTSSRLCGIVTYNILKLILFHSSYRQKCLSHQLRSMTDEDRNWEIWKTELDKMYSQNASGHHCTDWAAPVVVVPKKSKLKRLCVKCRILIAVTKRNPYLVSNAKMGTESLEALWYSSCWIWQQWLLGRWLQRNLSWQYIIQVFPRTTQMDIIIFQPE